MCVVGGRGGVSVEGYPLVSPEIGLQQPFMGKEHTDDDTRGGGLFKVLTTLPLVTLVIGFELDAHAALIWLMVGLNFSCSNRH